MQFPNRTLLPKSPFGKGDFKNTIPNLFPVVRLFAALGRFCHSFYQSPGVKVGAPPGSAG
jgi:hypothetical protein